MKTMIILYSDHSCGLDDPNNIEKYRDDTKVSMLLIPVNMYAPEYVILYPDSLPKRFELLKFEYNLSVEYYGDDGYFFKDCDVQTVTCTNIAELIRFIFSIYKIHGFNMINTQNDFDTHHTLVLSHIKVFRKGKNKTKFWNLDEEIEDDSVSEFPKLVEVLNYLINGNSEKDILPPVNTKTHIFMNTKKGKWSTNIESKHNLRSVELLDFNSITFISEEDYNLLSKVDSPLLSQVTFLLLTDEEDLPYDKFTSVEIYNDLEMEYLELFYDTESHIYEIGALVEILINLPFISKCRNILNEVTIGLGVEALFEVRFSIKGKLGKNGDTRPEYHFSLRSSKIEDRDYFDDFMIFLVERI